MQLYKHYSIISHYVLSCNCIPQQQRDECWSCVSTWYITIRFIRSIPTMITCILSAFLILCFFKCANTFPQDGGRRKGKLVLTCSVQNCKCTAQALLSNYIHLSCMKSCRSVLLNGKGWHKESNLLEKEPCADHMKNKVQCRSPGALGKEHSSISAQAREGSCFPPDLSAFC